MLSFFQLPTERVNHSTSTFNYPGDMPLAKTNSELVNFQGNAQKIEGELHRKNHVANETLLLRKNELSEAISGAGVK
jgi:hypothetical protein